MRLSSRTAWVAFGVAALLAAGTAWTGSQAPKKKSRRAEAAAEAAAASDAFTGLLVPLNATDVYGPESSFRVAGWNSSWGQLKLLELAPDGAEVKKGDLIGRFDFHAKDALRYLQERLQRAEAERSQAKIASEQTIDGLRVDLRRRQLEAQLASLDVQKERAISRRQADLYRISEKIAAFEAEAVQKRLSSALRARDAELAYHDEAVKRAQQDMGRYRFYEQRFRVTAPHDGVVRHAYNPRERRKLQKGDSVAPGQKMVSVAKDALLAVRFFVPEHRLHEVREGTQVIAVSPASGEEHVGNVTRIEFFPQELGFLTELPNLPNAREKAFAVIAELEGAPGNLSAGTELRVKVKRK